MGTIGDGKHGVEAREAVCYLILLVNGPHTIRMKMARLKTFKFPLSLVDDDMGGLTFRPLLTSRTGEASNHGHQRFMNLTIVMHFRVPVKAVIGNR